MPSSPPKRITPSRFHDPPLSSLTSHNACGRPPAVSILKSLPLAKKERNRPSGDQKGETASSVASNGWATSELSGRTQSKRLPSALVAMNATRCPSGDSVTFVALDVLGGAAKDRITA